MLGREGEGVGRASHKFTLSYHQMATIPFRGLADRAKRSAETEREREREREVSYSSGKDRPFSPLPFPLSFPLGGGASRR